MLSRNPMELRFRHHAVEEKVITSSGEIQPSVILRNREPKGRWNFQVDLGKQRKRSISRFP